MKSIGGGRGVVLRRSAIRSRPKDREFEGRHENSSDSGENTDATSVGITINAVDESDHFPNNDGMHFRAADPNNDSNDTPHHEKIINKIHWTAMKTIIKDSSTFTATMTI